MTQVRPLTVDELPLCRPLGENFFEEAKLPGQWNGDAFLEQWEGFYRLGYGVVFGAFEGEALVGVCGGLAFPDSNTGQERAQELFWWVEPGHRRAGPALALLRHFEAWAEERGCEAVTMAFLHSTGNGETLDRWYRRRGYRPLETHYVREL